MLKLSSPTSGTGHRKMIGSTLFPHGAGIRNSLNLKSCCTSQTLTSGLQSRRKIPCDEVCTTSSAYASWLIRTSSCRAMSRPMMTITPTMMSMTKLRIGEAGTMMIATAPCRAATLTVIQTPPTRATGTTTPTATIPQTGTVANRMVSAWPCKWDRCSVC